jgi:hypothetical protein
LSKTAVRLAWAAQAHGSAGSVARRESGLGID